MTSDPANVARSTLVVFGRIFVIPFCSPAHNDAASWAVPPSLFQPGVVAVWLM
jgi:hypothetical protein